MKCACGNELAKPRVKPFPVSYLPMEGKKGADGKKERVHLLYMGGFNQHGECWFCCVPSLCGNARPK